MSARHNFDLVARPYRWLEYLTLGRTLERTREHFLSQLHDANSALVIGDGDGRFLARLLEQNEVVAADAIDTSASMLDLLRVRCARYEARLTTHQVDALSYAPGRTYDLICTHFFLDCLTQSEVEKLAARLIPNLKDENALWLVSDFRIPPAGLLHWPAKILVGSLYLAFRILTGLRTTHLPDHAQAFTAHGLLLKSQHVSFGGILTTELWQRKSG
jgi:SAM-dependent methyltransferase